MVHLLHVSKFVSAIRMGSIRTEVPMILATGALQKKNKTIEK